MDRLPEQLVFLEIAIPDALVMERVTWASPDINVTRKIGDEWLKCKESAVLRVPTVLVPGEFNYLLNPNHPQFAEIKTIGKQPFAFDSRLLGAPSLPNS